PPSPKQSTSMCAVWETGERHTHTALHTRRYTHAAHRCALLGRRGKDTHTHSVTHTPLIDVLCLGDGGMTHTHTALHTQRYTHSVTHTPLIDELCLGDGGMTHTQRYTHSVTHMTHRCA